MAGPEDDRDLAAEYALGTLDAAESAAFEAQLARDPALAAEVAAWQQRLAPLADGTPTVEPPADTYTKILERIGGADNVVQLRRRVAVWRSVAAGVSAVAAALILLLFMRGPAPEHGVYVAVLQGGDAAPAFVAAVDVSSKVIVVRRVGEPAPADKSYELWALGAGRVAPQPLGVVDAAVRVPAERVGRLDGTTLAVSLEPQGGSPTGLPTGPVLFTGKLLSTR